jgi:hypothetical protein
MADGMSKSPLTNARLLAKPRQRHVAALIGLPLARGEDQRAYKALHRAITADIKPRDTVEIAFTQTITDRIWDIQRWRTIEAYLLAAPAEKGKSRDQSFSHRAPPSFKGGDDNQWLLQLLPRGTDAAMPMDADEPGAPPEGQGVAPHRRKRTPPSDADRAAARTALLAAYQKHAASLELIVRLSTRAEAQRDAAIRDLEWYRNSTLRHAEQEIEDAEYTEVTVDGLNPETRSQSAQRPEEHRSPQSNRARSRKPQRA